MADQDAIPTLTFTIAVEGHDVRTEEFDQDLITIGKGDAANVKLPVDSLAELHCAVQMSDDGQVVLLDLGAEATFLNGEPVNNTPLKDGDEIQVGIAKLTVGVKYPAPPAPSEASTDPGAAAAPTGWEEPEQMDIGEKEPVLDFVMRSGTADTDLGINRKAPRILEVAEMWSGTVLNVKHFGPDVPAVHIGDRALRQFKVASMLVTSILVLGVGFFMVAHASLPAPPRYPAGDEALMTQWNEEIAAIKTAELEKKRAKREAELKEITAEADERIAKDSRKYGKLAQEGLDAELEEDPDSSKDLAHFTKAVRDDLIDEIEAEREAAREEAEQAAMPPDPFLDYKNGWEEATKKAVEKAVKNNRDNRPLAQPIFELFEKPDWEDFVTSQMLPIAKTMAAEGKLRKSWISQFKEIPKEYDVYDDLDEKRVVEDLVLATRILKDDKVWMLIAGIDVEKIYVMDTDGNVETLENEDEVLLWAPTEAQMEARKQMFHDIQQVLYAQGRKRHAARLKCDSASELLKYDEHKTDFELNTVYANCLVNKTKFDQAVEYYERALENKPADVTAEGSAALYLSALQTQARIVLRNAWRTDDMADGDEAPAGPRSELMPPDKRIAAQTVHNTLRDFIIDTQNDSSSLKSVDNGIYSLAKEELKEQQQIQVRNAIYLALLILILLPMAYGFDEVRGKKTAQDFFVHSEGLPNNHFPIVEQTKSAMTVNFTSDTLGFLETADKKRISTSELVSSGRAKSSGGYFQVDLGEDERFVNDLGEVSFFIHKVHRATIPPSQWGKNVDWLFLGILVALLILGGAFGITLALKPYDPSQEVITIPDRFVELMVQQVEKEKKKEPSGNPDAGEGAKAKDEEGKTGKKEHKLKKAKGSKIAIQKSELDKKIAESTGLLADLNQMTDSSIFGTGGLDTSVSNALGGLIGSQYGNQSGSGGLGSRGSGFGGGGTAAGLGGLGTRGSGLGASGYGRGAGFYGKKGGGAPGVGSGDPIILGALDKSIIDRIVKQHLAQIRYCYQKELNKNPKLFGKIVVKFVIAKDGSVSSATTKSSTMKNPIVEKCVNSRFMRMRFPSPKGGGIVIVSYPFIFNSGN